MQLWKSKKSTVGISTDGALFELHDVLSQGPGLVWEDVLDLSQLLVQSGGPSLQQEDTQRIKWIVQFKLKQTKGETTYTKY